MPHSDYQRLVDRGRKAGLGTAEIYRALGSQRPEGTDQSRPGEERRSVGGCDANGQPLFWAAQGNHPVG